MSRRAERALVALSGLCGLAAIAALVVVLVQQGRLARIDSDTHDLVQSNCHNIGGLAAIERAFIERQEGQTRALLAGGVTFGIPPAQLPGLLERSRRSQALFVAQLAALGAGNCRARTPAELAVGEVRPGKEPLGLGGAARHPAAGGAREVRPGNNPHGLAAPAANVAGAAPSNG